MARWQLTEAHYLNVPGTMTEDRTLGENNKKKLVCPRHLDPNQDADWNYKEMISPNVMEGKIIVCHEGKGEPRDIVFVGEPTPGMLPIDDEAREISGRYNWTPTQGLDQDSQANSYTNQLLLGLTESLVGAREQAKSIQPVEGMSELIGTINDMMKLQAQVLAALTGKNVPVPNDKPSDPNLPPEVREFKTEGRGPSTIRDARRLAAQAREE